MKDMVSAAVSVTGLLVVLYATLRILREIRKDQSFKGCIFRANIHMRSFQNAVIEGEDGKAEVFKAAAEEELDRARMYL